ncbi:transglutaminase domain-containing protein [bacterium]|nr:MAG: transglutaminase domain-containing protein [bacterium]
MKTMKIVNSIIICVWILLLSVLLYKNYTGAAFERNHILKEFFREETNWYDIYRETKKIGFARTSYEKAGDEIIIQHERTITVEKDGRERVLKNKLKCLTDLFYTLKSFEYISHLEGEKGITVQGEVKEDTIIFFQETPETRRTETIKTDGRDVYLPVTVIPVIHQNIPPPQKVFSFPMLNLVNLSIKDAGFALEEVVPVKIGLNVLSLYKFRIGKSVIWTNERGMVVKEKPPTKLTLYVQNQDMALNPESQAVFDYTSLPLLQSNMTIPDSETLEKLRVRVKGLKLDPQFYEDSLASLSDNILTIHKMSLEDLKSNTYEIPPAEESLKYFLTPDAWVSSDYKPLQDTGRIYARSHDYDALRLGHYLTAYLHGLIRTTPLFTLLSSEHILKSRLGDHLERTIMFASYARAGGLPTRLRGGFVYYEGYFYFHTWPEIWIGMWIPTDPTLMQYPADVTHIPLYGGTAGNILSNIDELKNVTIEILEAS